MTTRRASLVGLLAILASLAACSDDAATDAGAADVPDVPAVIDAGFDAGFDVGVADAVDVVDAVDAVDVDNCDGGVLVDGGSCLRCAAGERVCGARCAAATDPTAGCGRADCTPCAFPNAMATCTGGTCTAGACLAGFAECDLDPTNGCEVSTRTDRANCGVCGNVCSLAHATPGCADGACTVGVCAAGYGDCDATASNGCEADVTASLANCGACGAACAPANAVGRCAAGACGVDHCNAGFADCDGSAANGCEVNLQTDATHCGACATACALANATSVCTAGACAVGSCNAGFGDCDGGPTDGCEVNLNTSAAHCGACITGCTYANAAGTCTAGVCGLGTCLAGFSNCDGDAADGCEVETASNPESCGICGRVCTRSNAVAACAAGACRIGHCEAGSADCDGNDANGCEVDTTAAVANCGGCGTACNLPHATPVCEDGQCDVHACLPFYGDCNGAPADGCESDSRTDVLNCNGCGNECRFPRATPSCVGGSCGIASCTAGFGNCDGDVGDGCESTLATDPANCGACGNGCTDVCRASTCVACSAASAGSQCRNGTICRLIGGAYSCGD